MNINKKYRCILFLNLVIISSLILQERNIQGSTNLENFQDWKSGMFVHWSIASGFGRTILIPKERIISLANEFDEQAINFDAESWILLAKEAGFKYIVPIAKHEAGFCLWPSKTTSFCTKRDYLGEIVTAARRYNLGILFYYAWETRLKGPQPNAGKNNAQLQKLREAQIKELVRLYHPDGIWLDNFSYPSSYVKNITDTIHKIDSNVLIGDKNPNYAIMGYTDFVESEGPYGWNVSKRFCEMKIAAEWCDRISQDGLKMLTGWFGHAKSELPHITEKKLNTLLKKYISRLIHSVGTGVNYLLNIKPLPDGKIPNPQEQILRALGDWIRPRMEAIYGTRMMPSINEPWGYAVRKKRFVYLHILNFEEYKGAHFLRLKLSRSIRKNVEVKNDPVLSGKVKLIPPKTGMPASKMIKLNLIKKISRAYTLPNRELIPFKIFDKQIILNLSNIKVDPIDTIVCIETK